MLIINVLITHFINQSQHHQRDMKKHNIDE